MWNPFLTPEERASIRRGGELMRKSAPATYWLARSFIVFCATGCLALLVLILVVGEYVSALALVLFWAVVYIASSWLAARDIRRE